MRWGCLAVLELNLTKLKRALGLGNAVLLVFVNKVSTQAVKNVMQCDLMLTKPNGCIGKVQLAKLLNCFVISRWSVRVGQGAPINIRLTV